MSRIQRLGDGGRGQLRSTTRRRHSRSHRNRRDNRFQPVQRDRVRFIPDLKNNEFLTASEDLVRPL